MLDWIALLVLEISTLGGIFIVLVMNFKRAALLVADQVTNASVISKDCRNVWVWLLTSLLGIGSQVVTCFDAANHKRVTAMRAGMIVLFKMRHN